MVTLLLTFEDKEDWPPSKGQISMSSIFDMIGALVVSTSINSIWTNSFLLPPPPPPLSPPLHFRLSVPYTYTSRRIQVSSALPPRHLNSIHLGIEHRKFFRFETFPFFFFNIPLQKRNKKEKKSSRLRSLLPVIFFSSDQDVFQKRHFS